MSPICLLSHHEWKQQQQQQPHPVSNGDYPSASLATSEVTYEEILKWTAAEWRIIDVLRHDGLIDRFTIVDTADSIFPIINQDAANLPPGVRQPSLATVPLGLRYEGTVDPAGRPLRTASSGHYTPISVFSRLYQTPDGLLGQVTSDGFFAFELRLPNGHHVDLKGSKLFMSFKNHTEINRRTSFNVNNGLLAICNLRNVRIYDLYQASSSLVTKINNGLPRVVLEGVTWISECEVVLLSGDGLIIVNINDGSQVPISLPRDGTEREAAPILYAAMIMCPQQTCLLLLDQHGRRMVRLALARPLSTCGRISRPMAYIKEGRQLHLLAMPPSLFSTNEGQSSVASLRDSSVVWKSLDIPFQAYLQGSLNGPIRVACQDDHTKWMLLAGRTGFCIFNHFGSGSGNWMLFSDPQECKTLTVKLATWIQVGDPESMAPSPSPVLSLYMWDEERGQHEFLLFVISEGRRFLSLHGAAHRQIVEGRIVALQDCGQGVLAILLDDAVLQLVQISMRKPSTSPTLRMSLILRASLDGVLTMGALKKTIQLTYVQDQTLLLVRSEDGLLGVTIPLVLPTDESLDHQRDISAKILTKGRISDFLVWPTGGGQHWIMAQVGQRLHCREVPLTTGRSFEFEGSLHSFYPSQAYGLGLKVELAGNGSIEHPHRLMVTGTEAFIVHLLHYLISLEGDDEGEHFYQLARSLDRRKISVFLLILEMLLERVLSSAPPAQQARIYRRLKYRLQDLVTGSEYRQVLFRFLRRIEAEDARRVMSLLGPFGELFERALRGRELLAAWSFYRIASTGTVSEREGYQLSARGQDLLERALEERQLAILRGMLRLMGELQVRDFQPSLERLIMLSNKKRDWPTLEILYEEGLLPLHQIKVNPDVSVDQILANCMLHSSIGRNDLLRSLIPMTLGGLDDVQSPITGLLQKISLPIESALWACIVEGRGYNEPVLLPTNASFDWRALPLLGVMSINAVLFDLQERLNLLNIQLVAARYGGSQIGELSKRIDGLQLRVDSCRSSLQTHLQRLEEVKAFCSRVLASAEECPGKSTVGKVASTTNPGTIQAPSEIPAITLEEFETVPKYMRGRLTREKVNGGVEFLNRVILDKYTFLRQNPAKLPPDQRQKYYDWKDCETEETVGKVFVTETDVKTALGAKGGPGGPGVPGTTFKLDSTGRAILAIMRHCGRIKEIRGNGMTRFVVLQ